ncbi:discoidin domain-containing protein [Luteimonas sp. SMYT11W]|uniref:Discoidin domain-containing protein n=1 Tax=Luteimonas flava TaxID=3115822 RepID=A0ABU7WCF8_9GAMM
MRNRVRWLGGVVCALVGASALAQDGLPPRAAWTATSSSAQVQAEAIGHLIDGDPATKTGGAFSAGHWFQVDLGRAADIGGVRIRWDLANPEGFVLQAAERDGEWRDVHVQADSLGGVETLFFAPVRARWLRLAALPKTSDWGVSIFEFEPLPVAEAPRIEGLDDPDNARVWRKDKSPVPVEMDGDSGRIALSFASPQPTAGLRVEWAGTRSGATLEARDAAGDWQVVARDPFPGDGGMSTLASPVALDARELRVRVSAGVGTLPAVTRLRLLGPGEVMTPMRAYQAAAARGTAALFPPSLRMQQTYWTVVGVHGGLQKSIFDEWGNLEAWKGAPLVQAIWRDARGAASAATGTPAHTLRERWMPMPAVDWTATPDIAVRSETFTATLDGQPVTLLRHRVTNRGATAIDGTLSLLVRPMQMNPPWQNGGLSPIREIAIAADPLGTAVRVNDRTLLTSLTPPTHQGAAQFGEDGASELTPHAAAGTAPDAQAAHDDAGLAASLLGYRMRLAPGASESVVVAFPLGITRTDRNHGPLPEAPALVPASLRVAATPDASFDALAADVADDWRARFGDVHIALPDADMVDALRTQAAYMLINRTGQAMQPGPRNYDRSFIRDGAATAAVLLRMGQADVARDFLRWYTDHAVRESGLVSPIINDDGTLFTGFGSDIEFDAQGQYIALVADVARLDGGPETVRDYLPQVTSAMRFLQTLRERTLVPGYMADAPAPERFRGIIAPSISHEGYSSPTHSYWDDYWALKGWHDGAWLAEQLGDAETAAWARAQYDALRTDVAASIRATMAWSGQDTVPAAADLGGNDPTSVSIALDPTGQQDLLPADALRNTFDRYLADFRRNGAPDALYAYSPYELRNVLTFVHLDQPDAAWEMLSRMLADRRPQPWHVWGEVVHSRLRFPRYLGDMPHTWIGAEYARAVFGMLMREEDTVLQLLPGTPTDWLAGEGLRLDALPTAYGPLTLHARGDATRLDVALGDGLRAGSTVHLAWPQRTRPQRVRVDGVETRDYDAQGITLPTSFRTLEADWSTN